MHINIPGSEEGGLYVEKGFWLKGREEWGKRSPPTTPPHNPLYSVYVRWVGEEEEEAFHEF